MRHAMLTGALVLGLVLTLAAGEQQAPAVNVDSKIDAVTVYLDRALVSRRAMVRVAKGLQKVCFAGLPAELDDGSLRLSIGGPARLDALHAQRIFLEQPQEALQGEGGPVPPVVTVDRRQHGQGPAQAASEGLPVEPEDVLVAEIEGVLPAGGDDVHDEPGADSVGQEGRHHGPGAGTDVDVEIQR